MRRWGIVFFIFVVFFMCGDNIRKDITESELFCTVEDGTEERGRFFKGSHKGINSLGTKVKVYVVVKNIVEKEKSTEYWCGDTLAVKIKYGMGYDVGKASVKKYHNNKAVDVSIGDKVIIIGRKENLDNFFIKDFNYGRYLRSKGCKKYIRIEDMRIVSESFFYKYIGKLKSYLVDTNRKLYKSNSDILNSILLADKTTLSQEDRYIFSDSGTSHIMAVSGLHVSIICGIILVFIGKVNSYGRLIMLTCFLYFYNLLVGGGPSITRAISMTVLSCMGFFTFRQVDLVNILFIIAGIMIYKNPYEIYNISFQLSFFALLSIVIFTKYIKKYVYSDLLATSIAVNVLTWPIVMYNYSCVSTMGIMGNIVVVPIIFTIVGMDVLSLFFYFCGLPIYSLISYINSSVIDFLMILLKRIGDFGVNNIEVKNMSISFLFLYFMATFLLSLFLEIYYIKNNRYEVDRVR